VVHGDAVYRLKAMNASYRFKAMNAIYRPRAMEALGLGGRSASPARGRGRLRYSPRLGSIKYFSPVARFQ
jgi:hypothetical protein